MGAIREQAWRRLLTAGLCWAVGIAGCTQMARSEENAKAAESRDGYRLVWADEFNIDGPLNEKDWNYEQGFVRNQELQWYQPANAFCKGGVLVLEGRRERHANPGYVAGSKDWRAAREVADYTSASVNTQGKHEFQYGRFEMRARIDTQPGSWPAFWTLGVTGHWPANGEVDIMEYYSHKLLANLCWAGPARRPWDAVWNSKRIPLEQLGDGWAEQFHVWRMDWTADSIQLYCDGQLLNEQDLAAAVNDPTRAAKAGAPKSPFRQPAYILLDQALGGQGGDASASHFPIRFEIDYVRVYQKPSEGK